MNKCAHCNEPIGLGEWHECKIRAIPKIKNYRNPAYLKFIRSKRSLKSGRKGTEDNPMVAAHQPFGRGGKAIKGPDIWTVPLQWDEHQMEHLGHNTFWEGEDLKLRILEYINEFLSLNKGKKI